MWPPQLYEAPPHHVVSSGQSGSIEENVNAMTYVKGSLARRLLDDDPDALGQVARWVAISLTSPRFWTLRNLWPDLCQEVMTLLVQSLREDRFDPSRDLRAYVQGITHHVASRACVRLAHEKLAASRLPPEKQSGEDPDRVTIDRMLVRRVLDQSTEDCRRLIRAYFYQDSNYEEIAASMNVPVGTVKSRLFRCMESAHLFLEGRIRSGGRKISPRKRVKTEAPE